jgi:peptide/nickel transport system permease protein
MRRYIGRRLLQVIPVVFAVILINFLLIQAAPGDAATYLAGRETTPEYIAALRHAYGLDKPVMTQFFIYVGQVVRGNLGRSLVYGEPVMTIILRRLPATLLLVLLGMGVAAIIGTLLGAHAARKLGTATDTVISLGGIILYSIPIFWAGLLLILVFAVNLRWFPTMGIHSLNIARDWFSQTVDMIYHVILPATALGIVYVGQYIRLSRASVAEVLGEDFITTSRAIGYDGKTIFLKHALRNALLPVITIAGLQLGFVFAGATLTETVFAWPGMGRLLYTAILARDYPLLLGAYLIMSVTVVLANLLTDLLYAYLDPRVTY